MISERIGSYLNDAWELAVNSTEKAGRYIADTSAWKWLKEQSSLDTLQASASTISDVALKLIRENRILVGVGMVGTGIICIAKGYPLYGPNQNRVFHMYIAGGCILISSGISTAIEGLPNINLVMGVIGLTAVSPLILRL